jgi:hypothetical protein
LSPEGDHVYVLTKIKKTTKAIPPKEEKNGKKKKVEDTVRWDFKILKYEFTKDRIFKEVQ